MIKVVIIEDNHEMCKSTKRYLDNHSRFEVVGVAHNGVEGLEVLMETQPDIALIDIVMPEKDGISILEDLKHNPQIEKPICIMLTAVSHDALMKTALDLGADYFVLKPFDLDILARRMIDLYSHKIEAALDKPASKYLREQTLYATADDRIPPANYAADILQRLGIPSNLNGYKYLKHAIVLSIENKAMLESITKILYPSIAKDCNTTAVRVERSIRHSIEVSWGNGFESAYRNILGYAPPSKDKPTNSQLIALIVEKYTMSSALHRLNDAKY